MKYLLIFLMGVSVAASEVSVMFDPSPSAGVTTNYIYGSPNTNFLVSGSLTNAQIRIPVVPSQTNRVTGMTSGPWYFVVVASTAGVLSDPSPLLLVNVPAAPTNLRIVTGP